MNTRATGEVLLDVDRAFSRLSVERGQAAAFLHYMAEDGLVLPGTGHPIDKTKYREAVRRTAGAGETDETTGLKWEPLFADVSCSGDIGYTYGRYERTVTGPAGNRKTSSGYYVTIWKKQADGSWKFVFDTGNQLPEENAGGDPGE